MILFANIARVLLASFGRLLRFLKTAEAEGKASLGRGVVIHEDGRIINIGGIPSNIRLGEHCHVRGELLVFASGGQISIGDFGYVGPRSSIWSASKEGISIGKRALISMDVAIHDTNSHSTDAGKRFAQTKEIIERGHLKDGSDIKSAPVKIGDDVWIGFGATIMKGVTIGDRAIVGAKAIVRHDVPADGFVPTPGSNETAAKQP